MKRVSVSSVTTSHVSICVTGIPERPKGKGEEKISEDIIRKKYKFAAIYKPRDPRSWVNQWKLYPGTL